MFVESVAGQDLTPEFFNGSIDNAAWTKLQAADQTITASDTNYVNSTNLQFALAASAGYVFRGAFMFTSPTTPDIKIRLTGPTGCFITIRWGDGTNVAETDVSDAVEQAFATSGSIEGIQPAGFVSTDTTAGNLTVAFAKNGAAAGSTIFEQGSFLTLTRVL